MKIKYIIVTNVEGRKLPKTKKRTKVVEATKRETKAESRQRRSFSICTSFYFYKIIKANRIIIFILNVFKDLG